MNAPPATRSRARFTREWTGLSFATAAVAIAAAGCASSHAPTADQRQAIVRAVKAPFIDAARANGAAFCNDFTSSVARQFANDLSHSGQPCAPAVTAALRRTDPGDRDTLSGLAQSATVTGITVNGSTASATLRITRAGQPHRERLTRGGVGRWRLSTPARLSQIH
jgi:hypothetical protein